MVALVRNLLWILIPLAIVYGGLRGFALRIWQVPIDDPELAASVAPTLRPGDWVILWRATKPPVASLVVCPDPEEPELPVMGRLLGEPGDRIRIHGPTIYRNGMMVHPTRACDERVFSVIDPVSSEEVPLTCSYESVGANEYMRGQMEGDGEHIVKEVETGVGEVYLVSDNRRYPFDSRDFGALPEESCRESVVFLWWGTEGFFGTTRRMKLVH
jgi:signal peptidase I